MTFSRRGLLTRRSQPGLRGTYEDPPALLAPYDLIRRSGPDPGTLGTRQLQPAALTPTGAQQRSTDAGRLADLLVQVDQVLGQVGHERGPRGQPPVAVLVEVAQRGIASGLGLGPGLPGGGERRVHARSEERRVGEEGRRREGRRDESVKRE